MELTETQELEFRAVAASLKISVDDVVLTRDTVDNFTSHQGNPKDIGRGYYFWGRTKNPKGALLVKDFRDFRAAFFQAI